MNDYNRPIKETYHYKSHVYYPEVDCDDERYLYYHHLIKPNGDKILIDFTNHYMTIQDLHKYIDLGYPQRQSAAPLSPEEIAIMWNEYIMGEIYY
jgi:hypothetical protein